MMKIYNTLSRRKEILKPFDKAPASAKATAGRQGKKLKLFVCGITPYDFAHLGHARTYVVFDAFVKYLRNAEYEVFYLQNVTDVDDKIIKRAQETRQTWKAVSRKFEKEYLNNMRMLGVNSVDKYARATEHIPEIVSQITRLLKKGYAYEIKGDGIYYDVTKFKAYGKLARRTVQQAEDGVSRIDESVRKRNKGDFALWKYSKLGEPTWSFDSSLRSSLRTGSSRLRAGRPGWHIEDTAITEKYFGAQYDIHGGGRDLIFPHHEAEIAQMEAISGKKPLAQFWMHSGFLTIGGEKMSKSLGNFITIKDFLKKYSPRVLRLLFLKTHYRSPVDYSEKLVLQTERELERIDTFVDSLISTNKTTNSTNNIREIRKQIRAYSRAFKRALEDDFNTPKAIAVLFTLIRKGKKSKEALDFLKDANKVLGFIFSKEKKEKVPLTVQKLVELREEYRKKKQWGKADTIRRKIKSQGWEIDDTPQGPRLKK